MDKTCERCYYWIRGKWGQILVVLGLRIEPNWFLLRAIIKLHGEDAGQTAYAESIILALEHDGPATAKRTGDVVDATQSNKGEGGETIEGGMGDYDTQREKDKNCDTCKHQNIGSDICWICKHHLYTDAPRPIKDYYNAKTGHKRD